MKNLKSIKIEDIAFDKLKMFCDVNGYKMYKFVSDSILEKIEKMESLNGTNKNVSRMRQNNKI